MEMDIHFILWGAFCYAGTTNPPKTQYVLHVWLLGECGVVKKAFELYLGLRT